MKNGRQQWIESNCTNYLVLSIFIKLIGVFVYRFSNNAPFNSTLVTANDTGTLWHPRILINFHFFCQNFGNRKKIDFVLNLLNQFQSWTTKTMLNIVQSINWLPSHEKPSLFVRFILCSLAPSANLFMHKTKILSDEYQ